MILYQIPGDVCAGPLGPGELTRREALLQSWAHAGTRVEVADAPGGPLSIETAAEEALCVPPMLAALQSRTGAPDAVIIGCFGDPGLAALREALDVPVVGPFEASFHLAAQLGYRVGVVTAVDSLVPMLDHLVRGMGESNNYAGAVGVGISVLELGARTDVLAARIAEAAEPLLRLHRADVLVLGCMSLAFLGVAEAAAAQCGVPVVNPARCALATAEALVAMGIRHSRRAYHVPPKALGRAIPATGTARGIG